MAKRPNRATISDVAQAAGVSISSVSNAINGKTAAMTEETLQRIQAAMRELDYRPSSVARGLAMQRTATLGLVVTEIETPLFLQAVTPIEREARQAGYSLLLVNARNEEDEREAVNLLLEKQVDGMMVISTSDPRQNDHLHKVQAEGTPVALINRADVSPEFDQINWDNMTGVKDLVRHFAGLGHRRIAILVGPVNRRSTQERLQGYRAGLEASLLPFDEDLVRPGDYTATPEDWKNSIEELLALASPPTAIIASDDIVAAVVIRALQEMGKSIPGDVAVAGIDDQPFSQYLGLTTMQLPVAEAGRQAINLLLERIHHPEKQAKHILLPCPLVIRDTCGGNKAG
ncbi:MAG: LacI family DNA-binding transcriptional regulator [Chloroflexota bacterium]